MAQRPTVTKTTQFGVETTEGTAVAANKILRAISFMPKYERGTSGYRPAGHKYETVHMTDLEYATGNYEGRLCYNSFIYILSSLIGVPTPVQIGATAARTWTFLPSTTVGHAGKSYTFEVGDAVKVDKYAGGRLASFHLVAGKTEFPVDGELFAKKPTFNQTQTATPTEVLPRPVLRSQVDMFVDPTTFGNIGTTKVTDVMQEEMSLGTSFHPLWAHNTSETSFRDTVEVAPPFEFSLITPHNSQSRTFLDNLSGEAIQYLRWQAQGAQIADNAGTPVYERIRIDIAGKFNKPEDVDEDDAFAMKYTFRPLHDASLGSSWRAEVINLLTAL